MQSVSALSGRRSQPQLSLKMQGKQPVKIAQPQPKRPVLPRGESKMAVDFYIASMLDAQVRQLMTEDNGEPNLTRVPTPYRKFLVSDTPPPERTGHGEDALNADEELGVSWFEYALDHVDAFWAYLWSILPSWRTQKAPERPHELPQWRQHIDGNLTPTYVLGDDPDTPGSQATPKEQTDANSSYFAVK